MADPAREINVPLITPTRSADEESNRWPCHTNSRLVIIALQLLFGVVWGIAWQFAYFTGKYPQFLKDPEFQGEMDQAFQRLSVLFGVGIFVSCGVINGAILYNVYMVLLGMVYAVVQSVFVMFFLSPILMKHLNFYIGGCVVFLLAFLTPHYNFVEEYYDRRTPRSFRDDVRADDSELFMTN